MQSSEKHYQFSQLGFVVTSPEIAHISVPIEISPIAEQMKDILDYANQLSNISFKLGNNSQGGLMVKALSYTADQKLNLLSTKFETIVFFLTRKESYNANEVSEMVEKRSIPFDHILPRHSIKSPRFSRNTLQILHDGFNKPPTRTFYQRRTFETPDDQARPSNVTGSNTSNETVGDTVADPSQAFWKWWTQTTTTTTAKPTRMAWVSTPADPGSSSTTTTVAPGTTLPISWSQMFEDGVDGRSGTDETLPPGGTEALDLDNALDHFASDFFQQTEYPSLYRFPDMAQSPDTAQNIVKRSAPETSNSFSPNPHHIVTRQVLMPVIVSLLASIGVSSIFSGVSAAQIDEIKAKESSLEANQKLIVHQTAANSKSILVNRNMVDSLGNLTMKLAHFTEQNHFENSGLLLFALMMSEFDRIEESLDTYEAIIQSANEGKYHPSILSQEAAIAAYESVAAAASLRGMKPVINAPQQIAQLHTHYSFTPRGVKVIIKVPLVSRHNSFELYKFNALPIPIGTAAYLYLVSNVPFIGIGESDVTGKATFVELTHEDLSQCQKLGKVHICDQQKIIKKSSAESCIYALYLSDHRTADELCRAYVKKKDRDVAVAIGANTFVYYSLNPSTFFFRCQNGSNSQTQQLTGITEIEVPEGCVAVTAHFILRSRAGIFLDAPPKQFRWSKPALDLLGNQSDINSLRAALDAYEKAKAIPALDRRSYEDMKEKQMPFYTAHPAPLSAIVLAIFAVMLVVGVILYIWCQLHRAKQAELRLNNPRVRLGELLEDNERLDQLERLLNHARDGGAIDQLQLM